MKASARVKIGGRRGNPGFRTPASFRSYQAVKVSKQKIGRIAIK